MSNLERCGLLGSGYNYRSAIWGLFVTKSYAEKHPKTTVKEKIMLRVPLKKEEPKRKVMIRVPKSTK